jgi:predicted TIM-barrel fold metal-dependent hydrolase
MQERNNRRNFLKTACALGALPASRLLEASPVIEWNAHIFSRDLSKYPFHQKATYQPTASNYSDDPLGVYLERMRDSQIDKAVIVHPEPYGDDHRLIQDCLRKEPNKLRGTTLFFPSDPHAPAKLEKLVKEEPRFIATRFHAHRGKTSYLNSFSEEGVVNLWKKCLDLDLFVELHIGPDYGEQVAAQLRKFPQTKVLIDHLAEPQWGSAVEFADILDLAQFPNVYMKLSGLGHFAKDQPLFESARSFTKRVIQEFGPEKTVWGSGSPAIVDTHMADYSERDRAKVKGGNLNHLINWNL